MEASNRKIGEIKIPVPWGHVAAKTWGEESNPLILCVHGIMDNAGTFNRLIPFLPPSFYYVSIDLPGHGFSSHFPPHLPIHTFNYIFVYKIIHQHFDQKLTILGHSYGGQIGFLFAQLYPECVQKLVMLDTISIFPVSTKHFKAYANRVVDNHLELERKLAEGRQPVYTFQEALEKMWLGRSYAPISREGAEALIERAVEPAGDGKYRFTLDQRVKNVINPLRDIRNILTVMKLNPVTCPVLIVLGTESTAQQIFFSPLIQAVKKRRNVRIKYVEGNHDVHNDKPELVAPHVLKFLTWQSNKL